MTATDASPALDTLFEHVRRWAEETPSAEVAVLGELRITYADLLARVDRLAKALLSADISPGDRVAVMQTPHPEYLVTLLAAASIGAIWVGLNPKYRLEELMHVMNDSQPKLLLTRSRVGERDYSDELGAIRARLPSLGVPIVFEGDPSAKGAVAMSDFLTRGEGVEDLRLQRARGAVRPRDACIIVYTSGSTGQPKGAMLSHQGICLFAAGQNRIWPLSPFKVLNYFPINHVGCVCDVSAPVLVGGGCIVFMEQFDAAESLRLMENESVTLWASVPATFQQQLALPDVEAFDLSAVQLIVWEGARMAPDTILRLKATCARLATNYGMTETTSAITILEPTSDISLLAETVGGLFPGVEARLVDSDGREVAAGEAGEVQARSALNMLGYWNNPQATAAAFTEDGYFRTGDLAIRRPDGRLQIVGRLKEMYKSGGYNVYPRELEEALESHPAVSLAAVVAAADPVWDEIGVAYVTTAAPTSVDALKAWCREHLANYKVPKHIVIEAALPLLPIGKIDKGELRRRAAETLLSR